MYKIRITPYDVMKAFNLANSSNYYYKLNKEIETSDDTATEVINDAIDSSNLNDCGKEFCKMLVNLYKNK